jgi:hypothetical protein
MANFGVLHGHCFGIFVNFGIFYGNLVYVPTFVFVAVLVHFPQFFCTKKNLATLLGAEKKFSSSERGGKFVRKLSST